MMSMLTPAQNAAKCAEVLALLRDLYTPTEADKARHRQLVADQMARDEAKRAQSPQLDLRVK